MNGDDCIPALKALSDGSRLRIVRVLSEASMSVKEVATRLEITQYNASKHLKILRQSGVLECLKAGKERRYFIPKALQASVNSCEPILDLGCCTFRVDALPK